MKKPKYASRGCVETSCEVIHTISKLCKGLQTFTLLCHSHYLQVVLGFTDIHPALSFTLSSSCVRVYRHLPCFVIHTIFKLCQGLQTFTLLCHSHYLQVVLGFTDIHPALSFTLSSSCVRVYRHSPCFVIHTIFKLCQGLQTFTLLCHSHYLQVVLGFTDIYPALSFTLSSSCVRVYRHSPCFVIHTIFKLCQGLQTFTLLCHSHYLQVVLGFTDIHTALSFTLSSSCVRVYRHSHCFVIHTIFKLCQGLQTFTLLCHSHYLQVVLGFTDIHTALSFTLSSSCVRVYRHSHCFVIHTIFKLCQGLQTFTLLCHSHYLQVVLGFTDIYPALSFTLSSSCVRVYRHSHCFVIHTIFKLCQGLQTFTLLCYSHYLQVVLGFTDIHTALSFTLSSSCVRVYRHSHCFVIHTIFKLCQGLQTFTLLCHSHYLQVVLGFTDIYPALSFTLSSSCVRVYRHLPCFVIHTIFNTIFKLCQGLQTFTLLCHSHYLQVVLGFTDIRPALSFTLSSSCVRVYRHLPCFVIHTIFKLCQGLQTFTLLCHSHYLQVV